MFDYNDPEVINNITAILQPGDLVYDCIGGDQVRATCTEILQKIGGGTLPTVRWFAPTETGNVKVEFGRFTQLPQDFRPEKQRRFLLTIVRMFSQWSPSRTC